MHTYREISDQQQDNHRDTTNELKICLILTLGPGLIELTRQG